MPPPLSLLLALELADYSGSLVGVFWAKQLLLICRALIPAASKLLSSIWPFCRSGRGGWEPTDFAEDVGPPADGFAEDVGA